MSLINSEINKSDADLFFIEKWEISKKFYMGINKTMLVFNSNYQNLFNCIKELKNIGLNDSEIEENIVFWIKMALKKWMKKHSILKIMKKRCF